MATSYRHRCCIGVYTYPFHMLPGPAAHSQARCLCSPKSPTNPKLSLLPAAARRNPGRQDRVGKPRRRRRRRRSAQAAQRRRWPHPGARRQAPPPVPGDEEVHAMHPEGVDEHRRGHFQPPPVVLGRGEGARLPHPDQARGLPPQGLVAGSRRPGHLGHDPRRRGRPRARAPRPDRLRGPQVRGHRRRELRLQLGQARR